MTRKKAVLYAVTLLIAVMFQAFWNKLGGLFGACPDTVAACAVAIASFAGYWSLLYAAVAGLLMDAQLSVSFGFHILLYTAAAWFATYNARGKTGAMAAGAAAAGAGYACVRWFLWIAGAFLRGYRVDFYAGMLKSMLPAAVLTALIAAVTALLMQWIEKSALLRTHERRTMKYR